MNHLVRFAIRFLLRTHALSSPRYASLDRSFMLYRNHLLASLAAVSPFRQRALKGTLHGYIFNGYSRAMRQAPYMLIPFSIGASRMVSIIAVRVAADCVLRSVGYAVYAWANGKSAYYNSKEVRHVHLLYPLLANIDAFVGGRDTTLWLMKVVTKPLDADERISARRSVGIWFCRAVRDGDIK